MRFPRGVALIASSCAFALATISGCEGGITPDPLDPSENSGRSKAGESNAGNNAIDGNNGNSGTNSEPDPKPVQKSVPEFPAAAQSVSDEAVQAFIPYYIALFNYGRTNQDWELLRAFSLPDCATCDGLMGSKGLYLEGGDWTAGPIAVIADEDPDTAQAEVPMTGAPGSWLPSPKAEPTPTKEKTWTFSFVLTWKDEAWRVSRITSIT